MQKRYNKKASITVFLILLLLLSASFFFALLETARIRGLGTKADIVSDAALESVFAEYQKEIYENYGLLMLDCAYGSGNFAIENVEKRLQEKNLNNLKQSEKELYGINLTECKMTGYQLLTDDGGNVFRHLAARTAKREALVQEVDDFAEEIQQKESLEQENGTVEERLEEANKTIEEVEQAKQAENTESAEKPEQKESTKNTGNTEEKEKVWDISAQKPQEEVKNPIEDANQWKKSAVLSLVVRDESQLSNKAIALEHTLEHRQKETGNLPVQGAILEELWFVKYLETHMGSYRQISSNHALDYEWEYILNGESSDRDNLKETVKSLIMIREIANKDSVILLQNAFPTLEKYIDHPHIIDGKPLKVIDTLKDEILDNFKYLLALKSQGTNLFFTDIDKIKEKLTEK